MNYFDFKNFTFFKIFFYILIFLILKNNKSVISYNKHVSHIVIFSKKLTSSFLHKKFSLSEVRKKRKKT